MKISQVFIHELEQICVGLRRNNKRGIIRVENSIAVLETFCAFINIDKVEERTKYTALRDTAFYFAGVVAKRSVIYNFLGPPSKVALKPGISYAPDAIAIQFLKENLMIDTVESFRHV